MIKILSPLEDSLLYNNKIFVEYEVTENSKFTSKVVFYIDQQKIQKTDLKSRFEVSNLTEGKHLLRAYLVNKSNKIIIGSETNLFFYTNNNIINVKNKLSQIIPSQIPSFIREQYDAFVTFIEKYYEFLETSNDPKLVPMSSADFFDIDTTSAIFVEKFRKLFIPDFPRELTTDKDTGKPINIAILIKRAKDFYESKGTQNSINFIFRILYDESVEFYYPREHLFIVSGGKWILKKTLKFFYTDKDKARSLVGNYVYQQNDDGQITAKARVTSCLIQKQSPYNVAEIELTEIVGSFSSDLIMYCDLIYQDVAETFDFVLRRGVGNVTIVSAGYNYRVGDRITLEASTNLTGSGVGYVGKVSKISEFGQIQEIQSVNFGVNYEIEMNGDYTLIINTINGSGFVGTPSSSVLCNYSGYYGTSNGVLGDRSFIQDNDYYQTHSYEIASSIQTQKYYDTIKRLVHPAGYKVFGSLVLQDSLVFEEVEKTNLNRLSSYYIGNFLAYRVDGDVNLRDTVLGNDNHADLFPEGFNHLEPIPPDSDGYFIHDPMGDPEDRDIEGAYYTNLDYLFPFVSDANEKYNYWVQFPHPSTLINTNEAVDIIKDLRIIDLAVIEDPTVIIGDEF